MQRSARPKEASLQIQSPSLLKSTRIRFNDSAKSRSLEINFIYSRKISLHTCVSVGTKLGYTQKLLSLTLTRSTLVKCLLSSPD
jgi:hypothetical protein